MEEKVSKYTNGLASRVDKLIQLWDKRTNVGVLEEFSKEFYLCKNEIALLLRKIGIDVNGEEDFFECSILTIDDDWPQIREELVRSFSFLKALANHFEVFEDPKVEETTRKIKRSIEIEGGLPFFKVKQRFEDR